MGTTLMDFEKPLEELHDQLTKAKQIQEKGKRNERAQHQKSCAYLTGARLVIFRVLVTLPDLLSRCRPYFQEVRCDEKAM